MRQEVAGRRFGQVVGAGTESGASTPRLGSIAVCPEKRQSSSGKNQAGGARQNRLPATPLPRQIPIDGPAFTAFPRVLSSEAFGRRPYTGSTARARAGIRNPSGLRTCAGIHKSVGVAPIPAVRRQAGDLSGLGPHAVVQVQQRDGLRDGHGRTSRICSQTYTRTPSITPTRASVGMMRVSLRPAVS